MDYYRRVLIDYEKQVIASLPNPFGSFEKAKYTLCSSHFKNIYSFTTTVHNTEDAIEILKEIIKNRIDVQGRNYCIYKDQNGKREKIYSYNHFMNKLNGTHLN